MARAKIDLPQDRIIEFCKKWKVTEISLFGSVLREDFRPDSDIDILFDYSDDARLSLFDHVEMQEELKEIFKRGVDLVSKKGIEQSRNYIRKKAILESAEVIYAAA